MIKHPIPPVFDRESRILILGSFPSVKSREVQFFYGHPQNRFWKVTAAVFYEDAPVTIDEKKAFLIRNRIAVWDAIESCDIEGSADSAIKNVIPNDLNIILSAAKIENIYVNGKTAEKVFNKYIRDKVDRNAICLPSTSPANAAWNLDRLIEAWRVINS